MKCYSYDGQLAGDGSGATTVSMTMIAIDVFSNSDWYQFKEK